jgi:hypothetical protein
MSGGQALKRVWRGERAIRTGRQVSPARSGALALGLVALVALVLVVAGCAGIGGNGTGPGGAALLAQVDYPGQLPVGTAGEVTLTLTPQARPGHGTAAGATDGAAGEGMIALPADPENYLDIGVSADAMADGSSPFAWELTTPYRQSLLGTASDGAHGYVPVTFHWRVTALDAGQNTQKIVLGVYYIYRDGSEHDGTVHLTGTPVPIRAVDATLLNTTLPPWRWPIAGVALLLAALAFLRFWWGVVRVLADGGRRRQSDAWGAMASRSRGYVGIERGRPARLPRPEARQLLVRRDEDEW